MSSTRRRVLGFVLGAALLVPLAGVAPAAAQQSDPQPPEESTRLTAVPEDLTPFAEATGDFEKIQLTEDVGEPMALAVTPDGRVLMTDRRGIIKIFNPDSYNVTTAAEIEVYAGEEDGLQGIAVDPNFEENGWVYTYYSPPDPEPRNRLSRFKLEGDVIDRESEQIILEVPTQRDLCCHVGGDIDFDSAGNLFLSTGDNTNSWASDGYTPIDEREDRSAFDAQRSSGNTNDLRGKLLRIHVEEDGSYTIPEGNLFPEGTEGTRPEVYYMGLRNPFRFSVDQETDRIFLGVVGPDARDANPDRGPHAFDEVYLMDGPGNGGWPFCMGPNEPYRDYDFATGESGEAFDCSAPVNDSPNNTGLTDLPPATPADIYYTYGCSEEFPEIPCEGGNSAFGGPVYRYDESLDSPTKFPESYDGAHFFYEYSRNFVADVRFDENGEYSSMTPFLEELDFNQPMDMEFGPEGSLYVIEYGGGFFTPGTYAGLYRIDYTEGVQSPDVALASTETSGEAPLEVSFDATGTTDPNGGELSYAWDFEGDGVNDAEGITGTHTYTENGIYNAKLEVTNSAGRVTVRRVTITIGNYAPEVEFTTPGNGALFGWGDEIAYDVSVDDVEDGTIGDGISCSAVTVQTALGHDVHAHPQSNMQSCEGVTTTQEDGGHGGEANLFWVLRSSYEDRGAEGVAATSGEQEIILQPKRKQAIHFDGSEGVEVIDDEAAEGGRALGGVNAGDWVSFSPYNLAMIDSVRLGAAGLAGGTVELRANAPDGEVISTTEVPAGSGDEYVELDPTEITAPEGTFELFVVFAGEGDEELLKLNYLDFDGLGAAGPRVIHAESDVDRGAAPLAANLTVSGEALPEGTTFSWDLGDGNTAEGESVSHTYEATGEYTATVTATDADGVVRGSAETTIAVHEPIDGTIEVTPESAELNTREQQQVSATFTPGEGTPADSAVSIEVYRSSPASELPPGHTEGEPYVRVEQHVAEPDENGAVTFDYTSTVGASDHIVACLGYGGSCVRGESLVVTDEGPVNLREDLASDSGSVSWQATPDEEGWITLFDGKSLAGWDHVGQGGFEVTEEGLLKPQTGGFGVLYYDDAEFEDYVLEAEYESFSVSANSGLYQRFPDPEGDAGVPGREGYEVAILDRVDNVVNRTGSINGLMAAKYLTAKPPYGGWNLFEIDVTGDQYNVVLNDRVVTEYTGDGSRGQGGHIGLENSNANQLHFRNIRIKPADGGGEEDTTAPVTSASTTPGEPDGQDGWFTSSPVQVTLEATDDDSGIDTTEYRIGDGDWTTYQEPITLTDDGTHTVEYRSTDTAGNIEEPQTLDIAIDTTAPTTEATFPDAGEGGWHDGEVTVALEGIDEGSGVARTEWSLDGGDWTTYEEPVTVTGEGPHSVLYRTIDIAGNIEAEKAATILIDPTAPTLVVAGVADGRVYGDATDLVLHWQAKDATSGVATTVGTLNGEELESGEYLPLHRLPLGVQELSVTASDNAGNTTEQSVSFATNTSTRDISQLIDRFRATNRLSLTATIQLREQLTEARLAEARGDDLATIDELHSLLEAIGDTTLVTADDVRETLSRDIQAVIDAIEGV
ncbi:OmpL47-type beta-barrel domain-containing protein [Actinoalloteichus hymeniacidonis]|uniref:Glucose/sorbosone dehydrogenase n=1 Tax=Actinoalloteichus hymeniacidonis TaxID=340345 RepID=A0AAC9HPQ9_9PSEU|nr:PQQ-dependent sugar dehydrogenase [Actinoalloteichus hymeniacidonis]AOS63199.1 glucose/sorbosone dehydrogenase [Actinoalloteichus hymeniacidonis]MBB5908764.1 glucose/arabinose dehydrogenase [Actinoalloteichus hymeniacidonis]